MRKALIETIRAALVDALRFNEGSVNLAAYELMIGRVTLYRKIKELEIQKWEYSAQAI
jgi:transcriptional regulator of acetoin/glycerol metabolism